MRLLRMQDVLDETGYKSHTSINSLKHQGLFTNPVPIGLRSVGWPDYEVNAINVARAAGKTEEQIRELVNRLHVQRQEMAEALLGCQHHTQEAPSHGPDLHVCLPSDAQGGT